MTSYGKKDRQLSNYWSVNGSTVADAMRTPMRPPSQVRTLADMSADEIAEIERRYGAQVKR